MYVYRDLKVAAACVNLAGALLQILQSLLHSVHPREFSMGVNQGLEASQLCYCREEATLSS